MSAPGRRWRSLGAALLAPLLVAACVTVNPPTKVYRGPGWYTVKPSDTLYSIAWRYGLDYKELARWNGIDIAAPIYPGQRLRLVSPAGTVTARPAPAPAPASGGPAADAGADARSPAADADPGRWLWPTGGKLLSTFLASDIGRRGIDIGGALGQDVRAVADGRVVYSGNGLAGYGNLIIIKHSDTYLSAYAHCQERLVQEGNTVKAGTVVARMGQKDDTAKLYFEIRRNGKPVDPLKYLPKQ